MVDFGINIAFLQTLKIVKYWYWFCIRFLQALNIVKYWFCTSINNCQILILILYSLCTSSEKLSNISCVREGKDKFAYFSHIPSHTLSLWLDFITGFKAKNYIFRKNNIILLLLKVVCTFLKSWDVLSRTFPTFQGELVPLWLNFTAVTCKYFAIAPLNVEPTETMCQLSFSFPEMPFWQCLFSQIFSVGGIVLPCFWPMTN